MKSSGRKNQIKKSVRELVPLASLEDFNAIIDTALAGHLRHLPPSIVAWQSVTTRARHAYTEYDALLSEGYDADAARHFVLDDINAQLMVWGCQRQLSFETD